MEFDARRAPVLSGQFHLAEGAKKASALVAGNDGLLARVIKAGSFAALDRELRIFNYFIDRVMEKIHATSDLPIPPSRFALKAAARKRGNGTMILLPLSLLRGQHATPPLLTRI